MREFSKAYPEFSILRPAAAKLPALGVDEDYSEWIGKNPTIKIIASVPWTHHTIILDKAKTLKVRLFYLQKTVEQGWSKNILKLQIDGQLYERQGNAITNFRFTLAPAKSDLAQETFKSPYLLDFVGMGIEMKESDIEMALLKHINKYLLELGRGFAYMGNQYKIAIEKDEFFLDLLFFNTHLNCYVVFELKIGDFKPEYAGKLNFYINAVDGQLKNKKHNKTIGVLLCQTPNKTEVRYALEGIKKPIAVSDYKLSKALPKELKGEIPSISELEEEMQNELEKLKTPTDQRFESIKKRIAAVDNEKAETALTFALLTKIFYSSLCPLYKAIISKLNGFEEDFIRMSHYWFIGNKTLKSLHELELFWKNEKDFLGQRNVNFLCSLEGFKAAGTNASNTSVQLTLEIGEYSYQFILANATKEPIKKKLYTQPLLERDIQEICDSVIFKVMDWIDGCLDHA
jgi:predicted nuclease of restriction endonuclease-like (RecB) superfamily